MRAKWGRMVLHSFLWFPAVFFVSWIIQMAILDSGESDVEQSVTAEIFYEFSSTNGYHPSPTLANLFLTVLVPSLVLGMATSGCLKDRKA